MKVKVTRQDIVDGRSEAGFTCGCPINIALNRKLNVDEVKVPCVDRATLGRVKIFLPREAVDFQEKLMACPNAKVKPFTFEATVVAPD